MGNFTIPYGIEQFRIHMELWYYREHGEEVLLITIRILRGWAIPSELRSEATEEVGIAQPRRMRMVISITIK